MTAWLRAAAAKPIIIPELKVAPSTTYGYGKYLLAYGYIKTSGVTAPPNITHCGGRLKSTPKFIAISPDKNTLDYVGVSSPVVRGLAFVLSTCLSISLSAKSLMMHPADRQPSAPTLNKAAVLIEGTNPGVPIMIPQKHGSTNKWVPT